uniref:hypothetical protein n=1 Tax=Paenibacillus albidus TaxID=2041023 RepID=UPI0020362138|nr:hypothetical protein [Paenibacillus albidus]
MRTVRHLPVFAKKTFLHVPSIRLSCTTCEADLDGSMNLSDPSSATVGFFVLILSSKRWINGCT